MSRFGFAWRAGGGQMDALRSRGAAHCHNAVAAILTFATLTASAQTILDGPNACGTQKLAFSKFNADSVETGVMYGAHEVVAEQCGALLPGEQCVSVYAFDLASSTISDVFVGPPQHMTFAAGYSDPFVIDPLDPEHLLYVTRDELIETLNGGVTWQHVNDMAAVRAAAGYSSGNYSLQFTPDGLTLLGGSQVSDDVGRTWHSLPRSPRLVTRQAVYYDYGFLVGYRSTDRGLSWTPLLLNGYPMNLQNAWSADALDSMQLYAFVSGNFGYRIARSFDGGDNWTVLLSAGPTDAIGYYGVAASPDTAGLVYVSGFDRASGRNRLWKSTDSGDTWESFGAQVPKHLESAGCGTVAYPSGPLNHHLGQVPLVYNTSGGSMILFDAPGAAPPTFMLASSRRVHGPAGPFDIQLSPLAANPTTEPRMGPTQSVVFTFDKPIASATPSITEGTAVVAAPTFGGDEVVVDLSGVANQQYLTIALTNVTPSDGGPSVSASARLGYLLGDITQDRVVTLADLGWMNSVLAQPVTAFNFTRDVTVSGTLTLADKGVINANLTKALPAP